MAAMYRRAELHHVLLLLLQLLVYCDLGDGQPISEVQQPYRIVCYLGSWARYRPQPVQFHPEDVDVSLCTHLIFAFASIDEKNLTIVPENASSDPQVYRRLHWLKRGMPQLKILVSIGGWNMGSERFTVLVSSTSNMQSFANNAIRFLHSFNLDGLDINWEYPGERGSPPEDKHRFTEFLKVLRQEFSRDHVMTNCTQLLLSVALTPTPRRIKTSYDLSQFASYVDFINAITYNLHGSWEATANHHSPLYSATKDELDINHILEHMVIVEMVPREKINLALAFFGQTLNLSDPNNTQVGAPINGQAPGGEILGEKGLMSYFEVCTLLTDRADTITASGRLPGSQAPYMVDSHRWTGYDDAESIAEKVTFVIAKEFGGVFVWTMDMDDFRGICGKGHYPLMKTIKEVFDFEECYFELFDER